MDGTFKIESMITITTILAILLIVVWCLGAMFVTVITGWEIGRLKDILKIVFWPITVFVCSK